MSNQSIAFIGAGNMAEAMFSGMIAENLFHPSNIIVVNRNDRERLYNLQEKYGLETTQQPDYALASANTVIIAMKPKDIAIGLDSLKPYITKNHVIISVVAGVSTESIEALLGMNIPVVRAMPNTSATIGKSATGLCAGQFANDDHIKSATSLLQTIGSVSIVEEKDLHAVTGLSGSGPAYIYYLVEAMEHAAINLGLDRKVAKELVVQTIIGAGEMLKASPKSPETLRKEVMSPGGTTEAGLSVLEAHNVQDAVMRCIERAATRSSELGEELDKLFEQHQS